VRILLRYLVKEFVVPLVLWVAFLYLILFVMQFLRGTDVLLGSAVTGREFFKLLLFLTPHFLVMAIPVAFLLAILLGLGRLTEDRELVALHALGVSPQRILAVPLLMGLVLGVVTFTMSCTLQPWGLTALKGMVNEVIKKNLVGETKSGVFYDELTHLTLYAERVHREKRRWTNVLIHDDRDPASPLLVLAREGRVNAAGTGVSLKLALTDGFVHLANRSTTDYTLLSFERGDFAVGVEDTILLKNRFRSPQQEMTPLELLQAAREAKESGENPRPFLMAYQGRFSQALTPMAFALLGTPLAMSRRQSKGRGYLLTIFGYIGYYVLTRMFENLGSQGKLPLLLAAQLPNVFFAAIGIYGILRVTRFGAAR
jgi:lipopolysaccharide export system permease protein